MTKHSRADGFTPHPIITAHGSQHAQPKITTVQPAAGPTEGEVGLGKSLNNPVPCKSWRLMMSLPID